jgi:predicted transcriptional regulator
MPTLTDKTVATSIKLPAELKAQIDETAQRAGISAHAFMVKTLADATARARLREQFQQDSLEALREVEDSGLAYDFDDVREYFVKRAAWRHGEGPEPQRPPLKPWRGLPGQ